MYRTICLGNTSIQAIDTMGFTSWWTLDFSGPASKIPKSTTRRFQFGVVRLLNCQKLKVATIPLNHYEIMLKSLDALQSQAKKYYLLLSLYIS